jgi:hypothetical protein
MLSSRALRSAPAAGAPARRAVVTRFANDPSGSTGTKAKIQFTLPHHVEFGQEVALVGDADILGGCARLGAASFPGAAGLACAARAGGVIAAPGAGFWTGAVTAGRPSHQATPAPAVAARFKPPAPARTPPLPRAGKWDATAAVSMNWTDGDVWTATAEVPLG